MAPVQINLSANHLYFVETFFYPLWSKNFLHYRVILTLNFEGAREKKKEKRKDLKVDGNSGVKKIFPPWRK